MKLLEKREMNGVSAEFNVNKESKASEECQLSTINFGTQQWIIITQCDNIQIVFGELPNLFTLWSRLHCVQLKFTKTVVYSWEIT